MKIAAAMQSAFTAQKNRDLIGLNRESMVETHLRLEAAITAAITAAEREAAEHRCDILTCERARFWRDRYDNAVDEIGDLHAELARHGIRPARRRDGNEANYGPLTA